MMISAVILAKNAQNTIVDAIESVVWCDEVIIIDDKSTDNTKELANRTGAIVYEHALEDDFSKQRNFGCEKAKGEWVLFIDADEVVSKELQHEMLHAIDAQAISGYYLKRIDTLWGKKLLYGETANVLLLRLAKKNAGKWEGKVHEQWRINGSTKVLTYPLFHFPHQTIAEFLSEINYYSTLRAKELYSQNNKVSWFTIIIYPKAKFFLNYIFRLGFRDGLPGLVIALMMSFHSFLVRAKLWQLWQSTK